jgi:CheY-like chemotaxis protein
MSMDEPLAEALAASPFSLAGRRVLLVDDNPLVRESLGLVLQHKGFEVATAASAPQALALIAAERFDVLLTDLHMPQAGDGLTVVSAMRHSQPHVVTIVFSGFPEMRAAAAAILLQVDQVLVKPMGVESLLQTIQEQLGKEPSPLQKIESVAGILERETSATISDWLLRVELEPQLTVVQLEITERYGHLPQVFRDIIGRLRNPLPLGSKALRSGDARRHGMLRFEQGYSASMIVEESRMLQVSIFQTLQNNLHKMDFSLVFLDVMAIADEVDSQLAQAMDGYASMSMDA